MKIILLLSLLFILTSHNVKMSDVYVCNSKGGKKYHFKENCRGLKNCKHQIIKKSLNDAKSLGFTICGWED